jgi:pyruvate/2-oxoglutarate/acetoin dehydrogenase E1 component
MAFWIADEHAHNSVRGVYVCSPRDMTRAAGFYNTLLEGDDPAVVIEPLIGYRRKERCPTISEKTGFPWST